MNELASVIIGAVAPACIYSLIAVSFVLIYRSTRVFNFAQGQFVFIGALLFVTAYDRFGNLIVAAVIAVAVSMVIGAVMYLGMIRPLAGQGVFIMVMVTLILGTTFLDGVIAIIWGVNVYPLNIPIAFRQAIPLVLGTNTDLVDIATLVLTIVVIGGIALFLKYSRIGTEMRAAAKSTILASYSGVSVVITSAVSWALAFGMAGLAGIATAAQSPVDSSIVSLGLYAFPAIILGGMDSVIGALIGAFVLALVRGATAAYVPSGGLVYGCRRVYLHAGCSDDPSIRSLRNERIPAPVRLHDAALGRVCRTRRRLVTAVDRGATVDDDRLAGDVAGLLGGEKEDQVGDVLCCAETAHGDIGVEHGLIERAGGESLFEAGGPDVARGHSVHPNPPRGPLHTEAPGQALDARFCSGVWHALADGHMRSNRRHVDDGPGPTCDKVRERSAAAANGAHEVRFQVLRPLRVRLILSRRGFADSARNVDQGIKPPERVHRVRDARVDILGGGDVQ